VAQDKYLMDVMDIMIDMGGRKTGIVRSTKVHCGMTAA
jgi:hypothetical protein